MWGWSGVGGGGAMAPGTLLLALSITLTSAMRWSSAIYIVVCSTVQFDQSTYYFEFLPNPTSHLSPYLGGIIQPLNGLGICQNVQVKK